MVEPVHTFIEMLSVSHNKLRIDLGIQKANVAGFLKSVSITLSRRGFLPVGLVMYQWDIETAVYSIMSLPFYTEYVKREMLSKYLRI